MIARLLLVVVALTIVVTSCSEGSEAPSSSPSPTTATESSPVPVVDGLDGIPAKARIGNGGGTPRTPAYWAVWNSCADDNRADEAAANGGPEAGWFLVDDILAAPGIQLGDHPLGSCRDALVVFEKGGASDASQVALLAAGLLAAELNLNVGSETCPAAEEAAIGGQLVLSAVGFEGLDVPLDDPPNEIIKATPTLIELLTAYNEGRLCI